MRNEMRKILALLLAVSLLAVPILACASSEPTFEGVHAPIADTLVVNSRPYMGRMCYDEKLLEGHAVKGNTPRLPSAAKAGMTEEERRRSLEEVEQQQQDFGTQE